MEYHQDWRQQPYAPGHIGAGVLAMAGSTRLSVFARRRLSAGPDNVNPLVLSSKNHSSQCAVMGILGFHGCLIMCDSHTVCHVMQPQIRTNQQQPATVATLKKTGRATTLTDPVIGHEKNPAKPQVENGSYFFLIFPWKVVIAPSWYPPLLCLACGCLLLMTCWKMVPLLFYCYHRDEVLDGASDRVTSGYSVSLSYKTCMRVTKLVAWSFQR